MSVRACGGCGSVDRTKDHVNERVRCANCGRERPWDIYERMPGWPDMPATRFVHHNVCERCGLLDPPPHGHDLYIEGVQSKSSCGGRTVSLTFYRPGVFDSTSGSRAPKTGVAGRTA